MRLEMILPFLKCIRHLHRAEAISYLQPTNVPKYP